MKKEKFNLQDALNGRPVVTRAGESVKIAGYNPDADYIHKLCGWAGAVAISWAENGKLFDNQDTDDDLFHPVEEKQPRTFWVNEYSDGIAERFFQSYEDAKAHGEHFKGYITTHKITIP